MESKPAVPRAEAGHPGAGWPTGRYVTFFENPFDTDPTLIRKTHYESSVNFSVNLILICGTESLLFAHNILPIYTFE